MYIKNTNILLHLTTKENSKNEEMTKQIFFSLCGVLHFVFNSYSLIILYSMIAILINLEFFLLLL